MKKCSVYALGDSSGEYRYVGKAMRAQERFVDHLSSARIGRPGWLYNWMRKHEGEIFMDIVFESEVEQEALEFEKYLIARLRVMGARLCNVTDGGEGVSGYVHSDELKLRRAMSVSKLTPEIALEMVGLYKSGISGPKIAQRYGCSNSAVYMVLRGVRLIDGEGWQWEGDQRSVEQRRSANRSTKLSVDQVLEIVEMINEGIKDHKIASLYGVAPGTIRLIRLGINWRDVTEGKIHKSRQVVGTRTKESNFGTHVH